MNPGDTLIIEQPGTSLDSHLWIVISDTASAPDRIVIVNLTTHRPDKDQACVLDVGDHPFVRHRTCIEYRRAKVVKLTELQAFVSSGLVVPHDPCSPELLRRIRDGVYDSRMLLGVVAILDEQGVTSF